MVRGRNSGARRTHRGDDPRTVAATGRRTSALDGGRAATISPEITGRMMIAAATALDASVSAGRGAPFDGGLFRDERAPIYEPMGFLIAYAVTTMSDDDNTGNGGPRTGVTVKTRPKTKKPPMYKVLMLNDDYTPMEFVVHVLERFFGMGHEAATRVMLHVHQKGVGVCGVFTYEVAETKANQVMDLARKHQHPLQCTIEKD
jgi:ATP-dependent Clp protease adaptor protein ClpS